MIPDFIRAFKLSDKITDEVLLETTKKQIARKKFYEGANMIIRYKFHQHFDLEEIMLKLIDLNK